MESQAFDTIGLICGQSFRYMQPGADCVGFISCTGTNFLVRSNAFRRVSYGPCNQRHCKINKPVLIHIGSWSFCHFLGRMGGTKASLHEQWDCRAVVVIPTSQSPPLQHPSKCHYCHTSLFDLIGCLCRLVAVRSILWRKIMLWAWSLRRKAYTVAMWGNILRLVSQLNSRTCQWHFKNSKIINSR